MHYSSNHSVAAILAILFDILTVCRGFDAIAALQDVALSNYGEAKENLDWTRISRYVRD
jgi:hypothetical protein